MGPSGAGKDSLLRGARERLPKQAGIRFARRYITRPADLGGEDHIALSSLEFEDRLRAGGFFLHWRSHGYAYGIGTEIRDWLLEGRDVCVNGSRAYLPTAENRVPTLIPVLVHVDPQSLRKRLLQRGRESSLEIEARLRRSDELETPAQALILDNSGVLDDAVAALCRHILEARYADEAAHAFPLHAIGNQPV
jgi:ribose 1,5-bisphosphokinase